MTGTPDDFDPDLNEVAPGVDPVLAAAVHVIDGDGTTSNRMPVTVVLQGSIVAGSLCSRKAWASALATMADPSGHPNGVSELGRLLRENWEQEGGDDMPMSGRGYFHLIDAEVIHGNTSYKIPAFRGRLDAVGGFTLGTPAR